MERDADTPPGTRGRRQMTPYLGVMSRSAPVWTADDDLGAPILRVEAVSQMKGIDPVIDGERNFQAPGGAKNDGFCNRIDQHP